MACTNSCFENLIGLRDVCEPATIKSCIWLNEVGISKFTIENIITPDYSSVKDFYDRHYEIAVDEVSNTINANFSNKYITNSLLEGQRLGFAQENLSSKAGISKYGGIQTELINTNSYIDFYVSEISLFTGTTGTVTVKVYDLYEGKEIDSIDVDCVAEEQSTVQVNKVYKSKRKNLKLFFGYDTTGINSYKTLIKNNLCCGKTTCSNEYISAKGGYSDAATFISSDIKSADHTFGMSLVYSLQCNHTDWMCSYLNLIALPIAYKMASNIFQFGLTGSQAQRMNTLVTIDYDKMLADQQWYENKFNERIGTVLKSIQTPSDSKCFQCRRTNGTKLVFP